MGEIRRSERKIDLELIRVIAIMMVLIGHTDLNLTFYRDPGSGIVTYLVSLFCSSTVKAGVNLFFVVSGITLLGKKESIRDLFQKRILRIVLVIVVFTMIQYLALIFMKGELSFCVGYYLRHLITGDMVDPYWFLYMYLAFLMALPFLRPIATGLGEEGYRYLIIVSLVINYLLPLIPAVTGIEVSSSFNCFFVGQIFLYPLIGYYLYAQEIKSDVKTFLKWLGVFVVSTALAMAVETVVHAGTGNWGLNDISLMPETIALFMMLRIIGTKVGEGKIRALIVLLGSLSFGIYLTELIARRLWLGTYLYLCLVSTGVVAAAVYAVLAYVTAAVFALILKKIPGLNRIV